MSKELRIRRLTLAECRIDTKEWMRLYLDGKHDELAVLIIEILWALTDEKSCYTDISVEIQRFIDVLVGGIGFYFTQIDFVVSSQVLQRKLIECNVVIQNLFALSSFGSTDIFVKILFYLPNSLWKLLTLYNSRCGIEMPYSTLLAQGDPTSVGNWYGAFMYDNPPLTLKMQQQMDKHLSNPPQYMPKTVSALMGYFNCTYINSELDRNYKYAFNASAKNHFKVAIKNRPNKNKNKIAILTPMWRNSSATYKSLFPYIEALSIDFDLTLVHLGNKYANKIERSLFKDVIFIANDEANRIFDITPIINNDFCAVVYPDIGVQCYESVVLSNMRIAPAQIAMYGFPVSTFGSEIDFFIGGEEVEKIDLATHNYSEKLVTIKGIGAIPVMNSFLPNTAGGDFQDKRIVFLGSYYKLNSSLIEAFGEITGLINNPALSFLFLLQFSERNQSYIPVSRLLHSKLGKSTEINYAVSHEVYMQKLSSATICLDAYPFGGFNTIIDALHLGKPVVTWEGTKAYNRLASAVLRRLGLNELIATSKDEYVAIAVRLLTDKAFYDDICTSIASLDIDALLYTREDELEDFVTKIKMIINGEIKRV